MFVTSCQFLPSVILWHVPTNADTKHQFAIVIVIVIVVITVVVVVIIIIIVNAVVKKGIVVVVANIS